MSVDILSDVDTSLWKLLFFFFLSVGPLEMLKCRTVLGTRAPLGRRATLAGLRPSPQAPPPRPGVAVSDHWGQGSGSKGLPGSAYLPIYKEGSILSTQC